MKFSRGRTRETGEEAICGMWVIVMLVLLAGTSFLMFKKYYWSKVFYTKESLITILKKEHEGAGY